MAAIEAEEAATVYQLALWKEEHKRAMPVDFIRSALFAAIQAKDATYLQREQIASANGYTIIFTGRRLTQVHADVWEGIMYLAGKGQKTERDYVAFTAGQLLRLIGRATGKSQHEQLRRMISELTATSVEILDTRNKRRFWGSLLPKGGDQEIECDTQYLVSLNRDIVQLFARGIGTIDFRQRKKLLKKPLALWLQHFLSDDSKPVTVEFLHKHSGSTARSLRHFREQLRLALEELVRVGILENWRIDKEDVVRTAGAPGSRTRSEPPTQEPNVAVDTVVASSSPRGLAPVAAATRAEFTKMYPEHDVETCVAAWHAWPKSRFARNRHIAFLGFARKWTAEQ
ncbi:MAG TPA: plasmid replication initiator TrfA [Polyangiales bacterium]|nr:plasmid replication initiator TrfA [Polyangiales bacterium]